MGIGGGRAGVEADDPSHNNTDRPRFIRTALLGNEKRYYDPVTN